MRVIKLISGFFVLILLAMSVFSATSYWHVNNANLSINDTIFVDTYNGRVGIGTLTPNYILDVKSASGSHSQIRFDTTDENKAANLVLAEAGSNQWYISSRNSFDSPNNRLSIINGSASNEVMSILQNGNVGIGTNSPSAKLHVYGNNINTTSNYYGFSNYHLKSDGATDQDDDLYGIISDITIDDPDSTVGNVFGARIEASFNNGSTGPSEHLFGVFSEAEINGGTLEYNLYGSYSMADVNAGTLTRDVVGQYIYTDIESTTTSIGTNVFGQYVRVDADKDPVGTAYGIYVNADTNVDYSLYLDGATAYCNQVSCWNDASDIAFKRNITILDYGLEEVMQIRPVRYISRISNETGVGMIAQELDEIIPEVVTGENGSMGISYGSLTPVLIKAVQEQQEEIETLRNYICSKDPQAEVCQ